MVTNSCMEAQLSVIVYTYYIRGRPCMRVQRPTDDWVFFIRIRTACPRRLRATRQQPAQRRALLDSRVADRRVEPRSRAVREAPCCRYCWNCYCHHCPPRRLTLRQLQHRPNKSQSLGRERSLEDEMFALALHCHHFSPVCNL